MLIKDGGDRIDPVFLRDPRIKYQHCPGTSIKERLDMVLGEATGDIRAFTWDDDLLAPGTLSFVDATIGDAKWLYGRIQVFQEDLLGRRRNMWINGAPWDYRALKVANRVPCPAAFWMREAQHAVGPPDTSLACLDFDYWLRLGAKYEPVYTDRVMSHYRLHPGQDSNLRSAQVEAESAMLSKRALSGYYEK